MLTFGLSSCFGDDLLGIEVVSEQGKAVWEQEWAIRDQVARKYVPFIEEAVVGFRWEW